MNSQTNKSEEENDKIVILKFNYSNAKSKSKTFGEIELKYISVGDLTFFVELLDKVKDDKEFVTQVLYHQLTTPKVSFTEFNKIPDDELIEIARDFVGHEQHTFQYFRETTDTEFFTNFRKAIKTYHQKQVERLQITFNRHKIMHGEYLKYGRIDNTIRAFLILDFLATLSNKGCKS